MRHHVAIKTYNSDKPAGYGINFKSVNSVEYSYTHSVVVAAGKPPSGEGPHYTPKIDLIVGCLVSNLKQYQKIDGRNITMDRYYTSIP